MESSQLNSQIEPLSVFTETFGTGSVKLTTIWREGATWFKGTDVAAALGYRNRDQAVRIHVNDDEKEKFENLTPLESRSLSNHNERVQIFGSEAGFYKLVWQSKKPEAEEFKRWVVSVVLPSLRKTGFYSVRADLESAEHGAAEQMAAVASETSIVSRAETRGSEADAHNNRVARLHAIKAAKEVADQWGFSLSEDLERQARQAVNEVLLPPGWEQRDMIDAAEYLRRRGHFEAEIQHIASEFGRALKAAKENVFGIVSITNVQEYGPVNTPNSTLKYNAREEAAFLNGVYELFKTRPLYQKAVQQNPLNNKIETALRGTRGFPAKPSNSKSR